MSTLYTLLKTQHLQDSSGVIYWLRRQSTNTAKRLNFYLNKHDYTDNFSPGNANR